MFLSNAVDVVLQYFSLTTAFETASRCRRVVAAMPAAAVQMAGSTRAIRVPMESTRRADALWHASSEAAIMIFPQAGIGRAGWHWPRCLAQGAEGSGASPASRASRVALALVSDRGGIINGIAVTMRVPMVLLTGWVSPSQSNRQVF